MIVFLKSDGTIMAHLGDSIRQGSANTNHLYVVAPISTGSRVSVAFTLPNGIKTSKYLMSVTNSIGSVDVSNWLGEESDQQVSLWDLSLGSYATQVAGNAVAQIFIEDSHNTQLATASYQFQIEEGVRPQAISPDEDDISAILSALTAYTTMVSSLANQEAVMDVTDATQGNIITYKGTTSPYTGVTAPEVEDSGVGIDDVATNIDSSADADYEITISLKNKDGNVIDSTIISKIKEAVKATLDGNGNTITSHYGHSLANSESGGENTLKLKSADNTDLSSVTIEKAKYDGLNGEISQKFSDVSSDTQYLIFTRLGSPTQKKISLDILVKPVLVRLGFDASDEDSIVRSIIRMLTGEDITFGDVQGTSVDVNGSASIGTDLNVGGNANILGNLVVHGNQYYENVEYLTVQDKVLILNFGATGVPSGLAGEAIITGAISNGKYPAFGIMYDSTKVNGNSVRCGFGKVEKKTNLDNEEYYEFVFDADADKALALRGDLVGSKVLVYDNTTHTIEETSVPASDVLFLGEANTAEEDQVLGNVNGVLGYKTLANPMLYKYFKVPSGSTVGQYGGCFSLKAKDIDNTSVLYLESHLGDTIATISMSNLDLTNKTFDLYYGVTLLKSGMPIIEADDGAYRFNFTYEDISAAISYDTFRFYVPHLWNVFYSGTLVSFDSFIDGNHVYDLIEQANLDAGEGNPKYVQALKYVLNHDAGKSPCEFSAATQSYITQLGLAPQFYSIGDTRTFDMNGTAVQHVLIGFDAETPVDSSIKHTMSWERLYTVSFAWSTWELTYYAENALPAGTYSVKLESAEYGGSTAADGYYAFTTTQEIPAGGGFRHTNLGQYKASYSQAVVSGTKINTYGAFTDADNGDYERTPIESGLDFQPVADTTGTTYLGKLTFASYSIHNGTDGNPTTNNYTGHSGYGRNSYLNSNVHQWLNGTELIHWWKPKNNWAVMPSSDAQEAYLYGFDNDFKDYLVECTKVVGVPTTEVGNTSTKTTFTAKCWLPSNGEIGFLTYSDEGTIYEFYRLALIAQFGNATPNNNACSGRIKYNSSLTAVYSWLRSPYRGFSGSACMRNPSGAAHGTSGVSYGDGCPPIIATK